MNRKVLGYFVVRIVVGLILLLLGLKNILHLDHFKMVTMENISKIDFLKDFWFYELSIGVPIIQFLAGLLLVAGFFTKLTLKVCHYMIMAIAYVLVLGNELETAFLYLILSTVLFFLLIKIHHNNWSLDKKIT